MKRKVLVRCPWAGEDALYQAYHDVEWGEPVHDDRRLFEMLILEGAQAGLSWITVLKKRDRYRLVYDQFDPRKIARYDEGKIRALLADPGIIRNRLKIEASIRNAASFLRIQSEVGSFDRFLWRYVDGQPVRNRWRSIKQVPATTILSDRISKDLRRAGMSFVGPRIIYAFLQAVGVVSDHLVGCFRYSAATPSPERKTQPFSHSKPM